MSDFYVYNEFEFRSYQGMYDNNFTLKMKKYGNENTQIKMFS